MKGLVILAIAGCTSASRPPPLSNRADDVEPPAPAPAILDETGLRGHRGKAPTKQSIAALLPGSVVNGSPDGAFVVQLAGVPQPKLLKNGVSEGIAMLVLEYGALIYVFAREVTMPHGISVGLTRLEALAIQRTLACTTMDADTTCTVPEMPSFHFRMHDDRVDHVVFVREPRTGSR